MSFTFTEAFLFFLVDDLRKFEFDGVDVNFLGLKSRVEGLLKAIELKLENHYNISGRVRHNVPQILALNDTSVDVFLEDESSVDISNVGYFFLEVFATLVGLSWGIISMFI